MPLTAVRRPKFERNDIKQSLFSCFLSCQRLNKIQRLLKCKNIDGILIIIGIDGKFNAGALELFNYLFFNVFVTRKDDIERSKLDDDIFDDVMVCVKFDEVHVYCNGANYWLLLPYMAYWPGLRLHCISEIEMEDPEKLEKFKMDTFVEMTRTCEKIAVVTKGIFETSEGESFDPMQIESWPIIQSYAFDDFGQYNKENSKKGFFTLAHRVADLSTEVHKIYEELDPVELEHVYQKVLPQMEGLFENIFQLWDSKCLNENFEINEEIIEEPVLSYFRHLKKNPFSKHSSTQMHPFVLSGSNTRQSILSERMTSSCSSWDGDRLKTILNPKHMVIQCVNLHTGLVFARTVFLQSITNLIESNTEAKTADSADVMILSMVYNSVVSVVDLIIKKMKSSKDVLMDKKEAEEQLKNLINKTEYSNCCFNIKRIGNDNDGHGYIVIIQGIVYDIINENTGENLGSVLYADAFVVTKTPMNREDTINAVLRLGKKIPIFSYWTDCNLSKIHNLIDETLHPWERIINDMVDIVQADHHFQETIIQQIFCTFYADRLLLFNKRIGTSVIYPESVDIFEGESYGGWAILSVNCSPDKSTNSHWIWNANRDKYVLHIVFPNNSKLRKSFTNLVVPKWKEIVNINYHDRIIHQSLEISWNFIHYWMTNNAQSSPISAGQSIIDGISEDMHQSQLVKAYNAMNFSLHHKRSYIKIFSQLMVLSYAMRFSEYVGNLQHLFQYHKVTFESFYQNWRSYPIMDLEKLSSIMKPLAIFKSDSSVMVTVLCGIPRSGQEPLEKKITRIILDDFHWISLKPISLDEVTKLTENALRTIENATEKNFRILICAPPFAFPNEIAKALGNVVSKIPVILGNVCVCLNPESVYFNDNQHTLPSILDMCNEGWVNTIILTGPDPNSVKTINLHRLLKARNDLCTIFLTPKADVVKELDTILLRLAFQQERFDLSRIFFPLPSQQPKFDSDNIRQIANGFYEIYYGLYGPLLKENIIKTIRDLFKSIQSVPYENNIYFIEGVVQTEEDPHSLQSLSVASLTMQVLFCPLKNKRNSGDSSKSGSSSSTYIRIYVTTKTNINPKDSKQISNLKNHFLSVLKGFQRQVPERKQKLDKSDLTANQIEEIHKKRHLEQLPEGWFYNGTTYVHMDGTRSDKHPALPEFIDSFVAHENLNIENSNALLDAVSLTDAFAVPWK